MKHLDLTLPTPAENLACDEALLDACEDSGGEVLRFWEPREHFVVVGYANRVAREVNVDACAARGVPVFRRCSGGGTVLQGPGCLNYSVVLKITDDGPLASITGTNTFVLERNRAALAALSGAFEKSPRTLTRRDATLSPIGGEGRGEGARAAGQNALSIRGASDLCLGALKFSGNAQRRKRTHLLYHGTLLLDFNLPLVSELLPMPSKQPDYRAGRNHADFLANLPVAPEKVKAALKQAWAAEADFGPVPVERVLQLAAEKYLRTDWNRKF